MHILIVDDSEDARSLLASALREAGLGEATAVSSARSAYEYLGIEPSGCVAMVDLIFMDLGMPDIDGLAAMHRIRRHGNLRDVPIIVLTSHDEEELIEVAFAAGAIDYVVKPFRMRELAARARSALKMKRERDRRPLHERVRDAMVRDLRDLKKTLQLERQSDPLTGVADRRTARAAFHAEWRYGACTGAELSVLMVDVDRLNQFNDRHGRGRGDACLWYIARVLDASAGRYSDCVARYGDDEFLVLLPSTPAGGAAKVAEIIRKGVERLEIGRSEPASASRISVSVGATTAVPRSDLAPESLLVCAEDALFLAKERGRNQVQIATFDQRRNERLGR